MSKCLVCNISSEIMKQSNLNYSYLTNSDLKTELKDLVLETNTSDENQISTSLVYMFDYSEEEMNQISAYFSSHGIHPIYCASTSKNLLWTLQELMNELTKEHHVFTSSRILAESLKKAMCLPIKENKQEVEKILMESFKALHDKDVKKMDEMILKLGELLNG